MAIIAVITIPIILNVIENSRKGAAIDSAYGYKDAVSKYYVSQMLDNPDLKLSGDYKINENGKLEDESGNEHSVATSGTTPSKGYITIENNEIIGGCLTINDYKVELNEKDATAEKGKCVMYDTKEPILFNPGSIEDDDEGGICTEANSNEGTMKGCMKWYVINDYGSKVDLILDHNTTALIKWAVSDNTTGPADEEGYILYQLREDTKDWQITYTPKKYESSQVTPEQYIDYSALGIKARLIEAEEIAKLAGISNWTIESNSINLNNFGWLMSSYFWTSSPKPKTNYAWEVFGPGLYASHDVHNNGNVPLGVRPVITVSKSKLTQ